ncbi:MAG: hypothetical protein JRH20_31955, partial [Deltaproteobacteria bacterium]|nr:hypothetical protein [Deltaproteobacteria bacterium]
MESPLLNVTREGGGRVRVLGLLFVLVLFSVVGCTRFGFGSRSAADGSGVQADSGVTPSDGFPSDGAHLDIHPVSGDLEDGALGDQLPRDLKFDAGVDVSCIPTCPPNIACGAEDGCGGTCGAASGCVGPEHDVSLRFGAPLGDARGMAAGADGDGNLYLLGQFTGSIDFGGGPLTSAGGLDL